MGVPVRGGQPAKRYPGRPGCGAERIVVLSAGAGRPGGCAADQGYGAAAADRIGVVAAG